MRLKDFFRSGLKSISQGYGATNGGFGFGGGFGLGMGRSNDSGGRNWANEVGYGYDNSLFYAACTFAWNALTEVDIYVGMPVGNDEYEEVPNHPVTKLLANPNPWYDGGTYMGACILSELCGPGYSATYKHRSTGNKIVALEYIPHFGIYPQTIPNSGNFIDYWQMSLVGGEKRVKPSDILQQRFGIMSPRRVQSCVGPLLAVLLEVVSDRKALNYTASLLSNTGVTPHLVSPENKALQPGDEVVFGATQADQIRTKWEEIQGDNRGHPLILPFPVRVDSLSFNPSDMDLHAIHGISEERVCAALGVPPLALQFGTGLKNSNNRASAEAAALAAARSFVLPYMRKKANALTWDLIPELGRVDEQGRPLERVLFRTKNILALQEDKTETAKRDLIQLSRETINEQRKRYGQPPTPGGNVYVIGTIAVPADEEPGAQDPEDDDPQPGKKPVKPKSPTKGASASISA